MASLLAAARVEFPRRLALLKDPAVNAALASQETVMSSADGHQQSAGRWEELLGLSAAEAYNRKREWNRGPLTDLFPRVPHSALEIILDLCIAKHLTYDLSQARLWNARRYTAITVAHVRHQYSDYDDLLKQGIERFEARRQSGPKVWKVLRDWCPWDSSNEVLERCFQATLLPLEQREAEYMFVDDPMDIDSESDLGSGGGSNTAAGVDHSHATECTDDPMEID